MTRFPPSIRWRRAPEGPGLSMGHYVRFTGTRERDDRLRMALMLPIPYFLSRLRSQRPIEGLCAPDIGRDVQEILTAALRSSATGQTVPLPLATGPRSR